MDKIKILTQLKDGKISAEEALIRIRELKSDSLLYPLSEGQMALWLFSKINPESSPMNLPLCFQLKGGLNTELFSHACNLLLKQFPILTTNIIETDRGIPRQKVMPLCSMKIQEEDLSKAKQDDLLTYLEDVLAMPFSLSEDILIRANIFHLSSVDHIILFTIHHIVFDGSSILPFLTALFDNYRAFIECMTPVIKPNNTIYADFVAWEKQFVKSSKGIRQLAYWKEKLKNKLPILEIPTDNVRTNARDSLHGEICSKIIPVDLSKKVKTFLKQQRINPSVFFLALYNILLNSYAKQDDIIIGVPAIIRPKEEFEDLVGYYINMLAIRNKINVEASFSTFLRRVQSNFIDALDNSLYPFSSIVTETNSSRGKFNTPIFQVVFVYQNHLLPVEVAALKDKYRDIFNITFLDKPHQKGEHEFELEVIPDEHDFSLNLKYNSGLWNKGTIEGFVNNYIELISKVIDEPDLPISQYTIETKLNNNYFEHNLCIHEIFDEQVKSAPDDIAIIHENTSLTFKELDEKSLAVAAYLKSSGVTPETLVGICTFRSKELIIAILGILKAGGAYVPLDYNYPEDRLNHIISDSGMSFIIDQNGLIRQKCSLLDSGAIVIDFEIIPLQAKKQRIISGATPNNLAYIIYTSGSTGKPKGVMVEHRSVVNHMRWIRDEFNLRKNDRILQKTSLCFDASVWELFLPLMFGSELVLIDSDKEKDPAYLINTINDKQITIAQFVPSMLELIFAKPSSEINSMDGLRILCSGGEQLLATLAKKIISCFNKIDLYNLYGPTEATIDTTFFNIDASFEFKDSAIVPIGRSIDNVNLYVFDDKFFPMPVGKEGELYIGGCCLARGYINKPILTSECFINHNGQILYKTGDIVKWIKKGILEFVGRNDDQIKVRGYRINLGEIENAVISYKTNGANRVTEGQIEKINDLSNIERCKRCLLPINYPSVTFDKNGVCNICNEYDKYCAYIDNYFKSESDMSALINKATTNRHQHAKYDCLLLFSGGKDSSYVLHKLVDLGLKVLALTFDNGFISSAAFENIKSLTRTLETESVICKAEHMNEIFVESLLSDCTVCGGCFKVLTTIGMKVASQNHINMIFTGLSRGQVLDTKLFSLLQQGIVDDKEIEEKLLLFRKLYHSQEGRIDQLLLTNFEKKEYDDIYFIDYFRYDNASKQKVMEYLLNKSKVWKQPKDTGFCSTNCLINDLGTYNVFKSLGYHNYVGPLSWECRLGTNSRESGLNELKFIINPQKIEALYDQIGYKLFSITSASAVVTKDKYGSERICVYYTATQAIDTKKLRRYLASILPIYMMPSYFFQIETMPKLPNGKIDKKSLEKLPRKSQTEKNSMLISKNEIQKQLLVIWRDILAHDDINIADNFFEVGGNSFLAINTANEIKSQFGCNFDVSLMFKYSNIKAISSYLAEVKGMEEDECSECCANANITSTNQQNNSYDYYKDSLAIIGISCQFPGAEDHHEFWENLQQGKECGQLLSKNKLKDKGVSEELLNDVNYIPMQFSVTNKDAFDPEFFNISPKDAETMDPQLRLLLTNSWRAIEDAGYSPRSISNTAVFMSASNNFYQAPLFDPRQADSYILKHPYEYISWGLAQGGIIPTIISNKLGLTGPSYFIHSNCSSSLVGIYSAYRSLLSGDADYAIIGSCTLKTPLYYGYLHKNGLNLSSDGHCKAFDEKADGMVGGEGAAVIIVKRAIDAIKDKDNIYAILRGIAVNNDGADKAGFYAPSVKGQSSVIEKVLSSTGINPETISYVEAHGTGTSLGDPVEMTSLSDVYKKYTTKKQYCGIGSVKTNIGHLDTAAGLAGCIKASLSLYYGEIPPSINFNKPNSSIDWENSPFYVANKPIKLGVDNNVQRIAVSAFGIGGTNSHMILEQYEPQNKTSEVISKDYLVPISAKNKLQLKVYAQKILAFLKAPQKVNFVNFCYTLQMRIQLSARIVFIVSNEADLISKLEQFVSNRSKINNCFQGEGKNPTTDFDLFDDEEDYNELLQKWFSKGSLQKIALSWAKGLDVNWQMLYDEMKPYRMSLPTYPFAKQHYSLTYNQMHGCSIGKATKTILHPLLHQNTSDLLEQRFSSFFNDGMFIESSDKFLEAYYLEMMLAAAKLAMGDLYSSSKILCIKEFSWLQSATKEQLYRGISISVKPTKEDMLVCKIYNGVKLSDKADIVYAKGLVDFCERSNIPQVNIAELKMSHEWRQVTLEEPHEEALSKETDCFYKYTKELYVGSKKILMRLQLPENDEMISNNFIFHPYFLEAVFKAPIDDHSRERLVSLESFEISNHCTKAIWALVDYDIENIEENSIHYRNIDFFDDQGRICAKIKTLKSKKDSPKLLELKPAWHKLTISDYITNAPENENVLVIGKSESGNGFLEENNTETKITYLDISSKNSMEEIKLLLKDCEMINHLVWFLPNTTSETVMDDRILENQKEGTLLGFKIIKALLMLNYGTKDLKWSIITRKAHKVLENETTDPTHSAMCGFFGSVKEELQKWHIRVIDANCNYLFSHNDFSNMPFDYPGVFANRDGAWYQQKLTPILVSKTNKTAYKKNGVYVVIGGSGGLGEAWSEFMIRNYQAQIIWISRTPGNNEIEAKLKRYSSFGAVPYYISADVSNKESLEKAYDEILKNYKKINGIVHAAMNWADKSLINMDENMFIAGFAPKVKGSVHLAQVFGKSNPDFIVFFSSLVSFSKTPGQSNYCAGSVFQDAFAIQLAAEIPNTVKVVNWGHWGKVGAAASQYYSRLALKAGLGPIEAPEAMRALENFLAEEGSIQIICVKALGSLEKTLLNPFVIEEDGDWKTMPISEEKQISADKQTKEAITFSIVGLISEALKIPSDKIDINLPFENYGLDSIVGIHLIQRLNEKLKIELAITCLFDHNTINSLTNYILNTISISVQETGNDDVRKEIRETIIQLLSDALHIDNMRINSDKPFSDYGLDSIVGIHLMQTINDALNVELEITSLLDYDTVNKLTDNILSQQNI